jgi:hypothetical protein
MRRIMVCALTLATVLFSSGCVVAMGNKGSVNTPGKQAVVIDGRIYVVDLNKNCARQINPEAVTESTVVIEEIHSEASD